MYNTGVREMALKQAGDSEGIKLKKSLYLLIIFKIIWQKVQQSQLNDCGEIRS